jgi:hypothetical protein
VDVSFWSELGSKKLDEYQLSETPIDITGGLCVQQHCNARSQSRVRQGPTASADATAAAVAAQSSKPCLQPQQVK